MKTDKVNETHKTVEKKDILRVEPPNWWLDFKNPKLQLLVQYTNISMYLPEISHQGVSIEKIYYADSPNYVFIDLYISENTQSGKFDITFKAENKIDLTHTYELKSRVKASKNYIGFDSSDVIYLITPDRFANGNPENDIFETLNEKTIDRSDHYARHGGDIEGITNHLDYISDLGFTAIWPTPLLTNDMPQGSYHGYAMTNFYEIDPRFGSLDNYIELSAKMAEKGMKLIMDQVANHCGLEHWWMKDLPFKDWINHQENYLKNIDARTTNQDIYAAEYDKTGMSEGWFVSVMPDLNQRNPFMAQYTIQNSIWWIETANLGGIRQDTYPYPDKDFMSRWAGSIMNEYPNFSIVGEEWTNNPLLIAYWQRDNPNKDGYNSNLKSPMDFAMQEMIVKGLNEEESWGGGLIEIYRALANDFAYTTPKDIMVFPDNHDMSRIFTQLNGDITNTKMALSYLLTIPRIPQIYYGTEILMNDFDNVGDHGLIRTDFIGGWKDDKINAFTGEGLNNEQKDMQLYIKKLLNYRKYSKAIHEGKTIHFAPENGIYILFRVFEDETVTHIINKNQDPFDLDLNRFKEVHLTGKLVRNIITDKQFLWGDTLILEERGGIILTTKI
ncbi:UNVERIFIED_CONTAM: hypothetical protein GTU68_040086 [Idotea baltica]|nr:hypothetical protein [Idotea baltica]